MAREEECGQEWGQVGNKIDNMPTRKLQMPTVTHIMISHVIGGNLACLMWVCQGMFFIFEVWCFSFCYNSRRSNLACLALTLELAAGQATMSSESVLVVWLDEIRWFLEDMNLTKFDLVPLGKKRRCNKSWDVRIHWRQVPKKLSLDMLGNLQLQKQKRGISTSRTNCTCIGACSTVSLIIQLKYEWTY